MRLSTILIVSAFTVDLATSLYGWSAGYAEMNLAEVTGFARIALMAAYPAIWLSIDYGLNRLDLTRFHANTPAETYGLAMLRFSKVAVPVFFGCVLWTVPIQNLMLIF